MCVIWCCNIDVVIIVWVVSMIIVMIYRCNVYNVIIVIRVVVCRVIVIVICSNYDYRIVVMSLVNGILCCWVIWVVII